MLFLVLNILMMSSALNVVADVHYELDETENLIIRVVSALDDEDVKYFYQMIEDADTSSVLDTKTRPAELVQADVVVYFLTEWTNYYEVPAKYRVPQLDEYIFGQKKSNLSVVLRLKLENGKVQTLIFYSLGASGFLDNECYAKDIVANFDTNKKHVVEEAFRSDTKSCE